MTFRFDIRFDEASALAALRVKTEAAIERRLAIAAQLFPDIAAAEARRAGIGRQPETNVYSDGYVQNQRPKGGPHYLDGFFAEVRPGSPPTLVVGNRAHQANILEEGASGGVATPVNTKVMLYPGLAGQPIFAEVRSTPSTFGRQIIRRALRIALSRSSR